MLGISESTLSNKLTGKIRFNDAEIFSLSHWLGVPSDALLGLKLWRWRDGEHSSNVSSSEMSDGDTVELLNFTVGSDGKVQKLDESSLDTLLDTPEVAKMWGNAFCSMGGALLASVSLYEGMTS